MSTNTTKIQLMRHQRPDEKIVSGVKFRLIRKRDETTATMKSATVFAIAAVPSSPIIGSCRKRHERLLDKSEKLFNSSTVYQDYS